MIDRGNDTGMRTLIALIVLFACACGAAPDRPVEDYREVMSPTPSADATPTAATAPAVTAQPVAPTPEPVAAPSAVPSSSAAPMPSAPPPPAPTPSVAPPPEPPPPAPIATCDPANLNRLESSDGVPCPPPTVYDPVAMAWPRRGELCLFWDDGSGHMVTAPNIGAAQVICECGPNATQYVCEAKL